MMKEKGYTSITKHMDKIKGTKYLNTKITRIKIPTLIHKQIYEEFYISMDEKLERPYFLRGDLDGNVLRITELITLKYLEPKYKIPREEHGIDYPAIVKIMKEECSGINQFAVLGHTHALTDRKIPYLSHHPLLESEDSLKFPHIIMRYMVTEQILGTLRNDFYTIETAYNDGEKGMREIKLDLISADGISSLAG